MCGIDISHHNLVSIWLNMYLHCTRESQSNQNKRYANWKIIWKNQIIINTVALEQLKSSVPCSKHLACKKCNWIVSCGCVARGAHVSRQNKDELRTNQSRSRHTHTSYARVHILNGIHNELLLTPMGNNYCSIKGAQKHLKRIGSKNGDKKNREIMLFQCVWMCERLIEPNAWGEN